MNRSSAVITGPDEFNGKEKEVRGGLHEQEKIVQNKSVLTEKLG